MHRGFAGGAFVDTNGGLLGIATAASIRGLGVVIFSLLCFDALGEAVGYAFGAGNQARHLSRIENDRGRFLSARDRVAMRG